MNIYLISQTENEGYNTYSDAIVCAADADDARTIHPEGKPIDQWKNRFPDWATSPDNVKVELIGISAGPNIARRVITATFRER